MIHVVTLSQDVAGLVARVVAARPLVGRGRDDMEVLPTLCSPTTCSWLARALVVWEPASSKLQTINTFNSIEFNIRNLVTTCMKACIDPLGANEIFIMRTILLQYY